MEIAYSVVDDLLKLLRDVVSTHPYLEDDLAKVLGFQSFVAQFTSDVEVSDTASAEAVFLQPRNWRIGVNRIHALIRARDYQGANKYYHHLRELDSGDGKNIIQELLTDLNIFKSACLPKEFLVDEETFIRDVKERQTKAILWREL